MSTIAFEAWFSNELITYRDDKDMILHLLRTKNTLRSGFAAGFSAQTQSKHKPPSGYQPVDTVGMLQSPPINP